jgi:hypothetical protein
MVEILSVKNYTFYREQGQNINVILFTTTMFQAWCYACFLLE